MANTAQMAAQMKLSDFFSGMLTASCIFTGDKLGLYKELYLTGPVTAEALATKMGLNPRFLLEFLSQQAASGILTYDTEKQTFVLVEGFAEMLIDDKTVFPSADHDPMIGMFQSVPCLVSRITNLQHSLETGIGNSYDNTEYSEDLAESIKRMNVYAFSCVIPNILVPKVRLYSDNLSNLLSEGNLKVADIGCGSGSLLLELLNYFPNNYFTGFDISKTALTQANTKRSLLHESLRKNISFFDSSEIPINKTANFFDACFVYDVVHDCSTPVSLLKQVYSSLKPNGVLVIGDIKCSEKREENISAPSANMYYGFSLSICLQSSMTEGKSEEEKEFRGLGTLGLNEKVCEEILKTVGFKDVQTVGLEQLPMQRTWVCYK